VTGVISRTGRAEGGFDPEGTQITHTEIQLQPHEKWRFSSKAELVAAMAKRLETIPGAALTFTQPIADMIDDLMSGAKAQIAVKVFGDDLGKLEEVGDAIVKVLSGVDGVGDLSRQQLVGQPHVQIRIRPDGIARYGLTIQDVQDVIEMAVGGKVATQVIDGPRRFDVTLRYAHEARLDAERIAAMKVRTPGGPSVSLRQVADIEDMQGTAEISREDGQRILTVSCNVRGRDIGGFVAEAKSKILQRIHLPAGYSIAWGGQVENQERATKRLSVVVPAVIVLIFFLLYVAFSSVWNVGVILLNIPFALVGVSLR